MMQLINALNSVIGSVDGMLKSINVDDSTMPYMELALGFIGLEYVVGTYLELRQRQAIATQSPPEELRDDLTDEKLQQTRAYLLDKKHYDILKRAFDSAVTVAVLVFGVLPLSWSLCERLAGQLRPGWGTNEYVVSVLFTLLTSLFQRIMPVPWKAYYDFSIEARHGFNKKTVSTFAMDKVKLLLITFAVSPPIFLAFAYLLNLASPLMPLYLSAFNFSAQMVMIFAYPSLIAPLFNKYSPLPEGSLRDGIEALAGQLAFPLRQLHVMDGSRRTGHAHAFTYGLGSAKHVVLYDTVLQQCDEAQVVALVARELGHWKLGHRWLSMAVVQAIVLLKFALFAVVRSSPHLLAAFGFHTVRPAIVALSLFAMILKPLDKLLLWLLNVINRREEFQADEFAVQLGRAPELQAALKVLHKGNKEDFVVDRLYSQYHQSHPPLAERLRAIQAAAKKGA